MKKLIIASLLSVSNLFASTYIVEMQRPLSPTEIARATARGLSVELFDQTNTDYFRRTYRVNSIDQQSIIGVLPVKLVEEVYQAMHLSLVPGKESKFLRPDELFNLQWGLKNQSQSIKRLIGNTRIVETVGKAEADIRWSDAIAKVEAGLKKEPVVAVIDMGIDFDHPDLKGRIFKNLAECDEKGEIADLDEDKDKNGLKGDCMGWNFAGRSMFEARRPVDDNGHGTHVSGIIAAQTNKIGISGISSKIKILPVKVTGRIDESSDRRTIQPLTDRIAKGILYAANMGVDVINLSMGWTRSMDTKYLNEALDYAMSRGVIIVAAAGNNNNNASIFPCAHYDVVCVGAITIDGSLADFSNYGGEVDVLAPGEDIVSTIPLQSIPLQLNLQGYDLRSGTSQAAPHVSAIAALLRGNFPRIHRDEVIRRIVDSADPGVPGKSLKGLVNLKGAFEIGPQPSVHPAFKRFSVALYDGPSGKFIFPLKIKNFGFEAKDVVVEIKSASAVFKNDQTFNFELIRPGEVFTVKMEGELTDTSAHNLIKFDVTVKVPNLSDQTYRHEFRLARDILRDEKIRQVSFEFQKNPLPVGIINDGQVRNLINTVEDLAEKPGLPEFYLARTVKETGSMEVRIIRPTEGKLREIEGMIALKDARELLNVMKLDLNLDGEEDYFVRAIACEKDCETPAKAQKYIQYTAWKKDLTPLFGDKSLWRFLPTLVNVNMKSQRFFKIKQAPFGEILVPVFLENGQIPEEQQERSTAFSLSDLSVARRVYYILPEVDGKGEVQVKTRTLSTTKYLNALRTLTGATKTDEVHALHLLTQSPEDLVSGNVTALLSVGKGYLRKNLIINLHEGPEKAKPFSITQNILGYDHIPSQDLAGGKAGDSFNGLVSRSRLVMLQTELNTSYSYDAQDSVEAPLATIASFRDDGSEYTFFQTPSYIMLAHHDRVGVEFAKLKINRFSFLPGTLFNDSFYPVMAKDGDKFVPALYVDETDIQSNLISLTTYEEGKLRSPLKTSVFIPPICKALNPVRLEAGEGHSLSLLCLENKQWTMKFIPFNQ